MGLEIVENCLEIVFLIYLWVSIVTTEGPVLSTAFVIKICLIKINFIKFPFINCSDITFEGHTMPNVITEESNNFLCL